MIRSGFARAGAWRWHYRIAGAADAPPVMLLHGFPEYSGMWAGVMDRIGASFCAVAPDLLGYNLSDKPQDVVPYRTRLLVDDLDDFARAFTGARPFTLVADDWGGALAWAYALRHPRRLARLVIVNAVHPAIFQRELAANPAQAAASGYIAAIRAEGSEAAFASDDFARLRFSFRRVEAQGLLTAAALAGYRRAWREPGALTGMFNWYRAMRITAPGETAAPVVAPDLRRLTVEVPTHVLWGEQDDALLPGCLDGLEQFVPDLKVTRFPGGSHWLVHEEPEAVARAILDPAP